MHALDGFIKDFLFGICVKVGIQLALSILKAKAGFIEMLKSAFDFDTLMFGVFTGSY